jgi:hypothetical protein
VVGGVIVGVLVLIGGIGAWSNAGPDQFPTEGIVLVGAGIGWMVSGFWVRDLLEAGATLLDALRPPADEQE